MFFRFPPDARWNPVKGVVEFGIGIGDYEGIVRVPREVLRHLIDGAVTPEKCVEAYHLQRTCFEGIAEQNVRRRHLTMMAMWRSVAEISGSTRPHVLSARAYGIFVGPHDDRGTAGH
jgi:hypothetical protein